MQTFLPYKDFQKSAEALDNKRLNKQVLECYQILRVLSNPDPKAGWRNHPAVKMWRGHEKSLWSYAMTMLFEASRRGIKTDTNEKNLRNVWRLESSYWGDGLPEWFSNDIIMRKVVTTHKANLYRKDPEFYSKFKLSVASIDNAPCCDRCQYYWVTHKEVA
jgi:hypothetical protein